MCEMTDGRVDNALLLAGASVGSEEVEVKVREDNVRVPEIVKDGKRSRRGSSMAEEPARNCSHALARG